MMTAFALTVLSRVFWSKQTSKTETSSLPHHRQRRRAHLLADLQIENNVSWGTVWARLLAIHVKVGGC